jgi:hypothetical protein
MKKLMVLVVAILVIGFMGCDNGSTSGGGATIPAAYQNTTWTYSNPLWSYKLELRETDFVFSNKSTNAEWQTIVYAITVEEGVTNDDAKEPVWGITGDTEESSYYEQVQVILYKNKTKVLAPGGEYTQQ